MRILDHVRVPPTTLAHLTFRAHWLVRLFTVVFGAAAFESSVIWWSSEHRNSQKHVDHDEDPYSISKGFFYAPMSGEALANARGISSMFHRRRRYGSDI
jgi:fatty-acid desaturase